VYFTLTHSGLIKSQNMVQKWNTTLRVKNQRLPNLALFLHRSMRMRRRGRGALMAG
jgi:hypothetical protein